MKYPFAAVFLPAITAMALSVYGQVTPPPRGLVSPPPTSPTVVSPPGGADGSNIVLAPVRPNQSLTMNALLGFVNSEPVFVHDLLRPIDEDLRALSKASHSLAEFRDSARPMVDNQLRNTLSSIIVNSNAKSALSEDDKGRLEMLLNKQRIDLLAKHGGSYAMADRALRAEGSSVELMLADIRRKVVLNLYINKQINPKVVVTRPMVIEEYTRDPKAWREEEEVELFTITLPVSRWLPYEAGEHGERGPAIKNPAAAQIKEAQTQALAKAREIAAELKKSKNVTTDFARLAEDSGSVDGRASKGGRTPNVKRGSRLSKKEEEYIFSLPANTLGEPLLLEDPDPMKVRVEVIRVGDKKVPREITFAEAQEAIIKKLQDQQFQKLRKEFLDTLYKGAAIEIGETMTNTALDVAVARYATQ